MMTYKPWYLSGLPEEIQVTFLGNARAVDEEYLREGEQKENLCGPFGVAYILRALGYQYHKGYFVDQEYVAYLARTRVKTGEKNLYRYPLIETSSPVELGTSAAGLKYAIETVSEKNLAVVPIKTADKSSGPLLKREGLEFLVRVFSETGSLQLIFNLNTRYLLDGPDLNKRVIATNGIDTKLKRRESLGHFVSCAGFVHGLSTFFIIRETYKRFGVQLQPFDSILRGLNRGDGREGGILAIAPKEYNETLVEKLQDFELTLWDNGSLF